MNPSDPSLYLTLSARVAEGLRCTGCIRRTDRPEDCRRGRTWDATDRPTQG